MSNVQSRKQVLVVDDEPALRALLADFLGRRGLQVREAGGGTEMRRQLAAEPVDLVVLDVTMPGESGLDLLAELRAGGDEVPVVMLTACGQLHDRMAGLGRGADDYITKPFEPRELLARIRAVLRRTPARPHPLPVKPASRRQPVRLGRCLFDPESGHLTSLEDRTEIPLTAMELDLLRVMLRHAHIPLSRERLEELAHGAAGGTGGRGVDARIHRLRHKLEPDPSQPVVLRTLRGEGYLLVPGHAGEGQSSAAAHAGSEPL